MQNQHAISTRAFSLKENSLITANMDDKYDLNLRRFSRHPLRLSLSLNVHSPVSPLSLLLSIIEKKNACICSCSSFLNNQGTAMSIMNTEATFVGSLVADGNTGEKGGFLHIGEFGRANMTDVRNCFY